MKPKARKDAGPSFAKPMPGRTADALIEESIQLLRALPAGAWATYYAGTGGFALGIVYFWAYTSWFRPTSETVAVAALGLALLFGAMKVCHSRFCHSLLTQRMGGADERWTSRRLRRTAFVQLRLQASGFIVLPASLLLGAPAGYAYAFYQNISVLADSDEAFSDSWKQAVLWPGQNHLGLLYISGLNLAVALNIAVGCVAIPWAGQHFLGIENLPSFSGLWFLNTTFFMIVFALTWLVVDPLVKAFYTLRVFYGRSRATGEDLLVALKSASSNIQRSTLNAQRSTTAGAVLALVFVLAGAPPIPAQVEGVVPNAGNVRTTRSTAVQAADLNTAIDDVLSGSDFRWRLRPEPALQSQDGPLRGFFRTVREMIVEGARSLVRFAERVFRFFRNLFPSGGDAGAGSAGFGSTVIRVLLYVFAGGAILGLAYFAWAIWRRSREWRRPAAVAHVTATTVPDLGDEQTSANELPVEGWLQLAREQAKKGEWRLALRALHLASLARLAAEGILTLARFKTNLDYLREVRRRAPTRPTVATWFAERSARYEEAWYGRGQPGEGEIRSWMSELERPTLA